MAGDRARVRQLLDATQAALEETTARYHEASDAFDEEYPAAPDPEPPSNVIRVAVGDNVQAALTEARKTGATVLLAVGQHLCNLSITDDAAAKPVLITSDTTNIPADGVRITRDYLPGLAQLKSANNMDPVIAYRKGSSGVHLTGLAILPMQFDRTVLTFGTDDMVTVEEQPHDVVHDRLLMLGDPVRGQHRAIQAHVRRYSLLNSSLLDYHEEGRDSQAIAAWNGGQDLIIRNCHLEAGAENVLFGGGSARTEVMAPSRILIEDCLLAKNPLWMSDMDNPPTIKCLLECKHVRGLTIRRNVFEHNWPQAWSSGVAIAIKSCDQMGNEPWTTTCDVTFEYNVLRRVGSCFSIVGNNDDGKPSVLMRNIRIAHTLLYDIDVDQWQGKGALAVVSNLPHDFVFDHLTCVENGWGIMEYAYNQPEKGTGFTLQNAVIWQGNYGIKGPSGMAYTNWATDMGYAPVVTSNAIRRDPDRSPNFGPGNVRLSEADFDSSFALDYSVIPGSPVANVPTTDGTMIGADITKVPRGRDHRPGRKPRC